MRRSRKRNAVETSHPSLEKPLPEAVPRHFSPADSLPRIMEYYIHKLLLAYCLLRPGKKIEDLIKMNLNT